MDVKPSILLVTNLFPPDIGGPATYVSKIGRELHARGFAVGVLCTHPGAPLPEQYPFPVWRVSRQIAMPLRMLLVLLAALWLGRRFDVWYVNGLEVVGVLAARLLRKPVALKIVGDFAWEYAIRHNWTADGIDEFQSRRYPFRVELVRTLVRLAARNAGRVITPSRYLGRIVEGWGVPAERIGVVYNALPAVRDCGLSREQAKQALGLAGPVVLTVARLYPWKNIDVLIRLVPRFPDGTQLVIVGDGPQRAALEQLVDELGLRARVHFAGSVPHDTVQLYLRAADVFVLNTRYEGLSHTILEAMFAGVPVVASRVGGNPETIEHGRTGLLVELNDGDAIVEAVRRLLADPALGERLTAAARQEVARFSWENLVATTIAELTALHRTAAGRRAVTRSHL
jgi:glycosyltransferase involved in cell wall biosynthesis